MVSWERLCASRELWYALVLLLKCRGCFVGSSVTRPDRSCSAGRRPTSIEPRRRWRGARTRTEHERGDSCLENLRVFPPNSLRTLCPSVVHLLSSYPKLMSSCCPPWPCFLLKKTGHSLWPPLKSVCRFCFLLSSSCPRCPLDVPVSSSCPHPTLCPPGSDPTLSRPCPRLCVLLGRAMGRLP